MPGSKKQNNMFEETTGYVQKGNPFPVTSCGRRRNIGSPMKQDKKNCYIDDKGKSVCPYVPLPKLTDEMIKKMVEKQKGKKKIDLKKIKGPKSPKDK